MSKREKLIERFKSLPSDFTFEELVSLLEQLGFERWDKGKTSGSRVSFKNNTGVPIMLHRPHPSNVVKRYVMKSIFEELKKRELI